MEVSFKQQIIEILDEIIGNGSFVVSGIHDFVSPGLKINGLDEIGFPASAKQMLEMIHVAHKAPYGKGSQTILDTRVRSAWEIDAQQITLLNPSWNKQLEIILNEVKKGLDLELRPISAHLYKLLIYEAGDFFLPHKDSEKEPGMFGTLIIGLPSKHTDGALLVRFDSKELKIDFSEANAYEMPFAAFYADCEHEIQPITSGYRICLVYNLVQKTEDFKIQVFENQELVDELVPILETADINQPIAILLEHEYTPTNFSLNALKSSDRPKAEILMQAAEKAGFYAKLGLLTCHLSGALEGVGYGYRKRRYDEDDEDLSDGEMGEIFEQTMGIEHWCADNSHPPLSTLTLKEEQIVTDIELADGEPTEKAAEGFTGNAGMTMDYWYHYGAIVIWAKSKHGAFLSRQGFGNRLEWLQYYVKNWNPSNQDAAQKLLESFGQKDFESYYANKPKNFNISVDFLLKLNDNQYVNSEACQRLLIHAFQNIDATHWIKLFNAFGTEPFGKVFKQVAHQKKLDELKEITLILNALKAQNEASFNDFIGAQLEFIMIHFSDAQSDRNAIYRDFNTNVSIILKNIMVLSEVKNGDSEWIQNALQLLTKTLTPKYVNEFLVPAVFASEGAPNLKLVQQIAAFCKADLIKRVAKKPLPPENWTMEVPQTNANKEIWKILTPFLNSPTQMVFNYQKSLAEKKAMEAFVHNANIDLSTTMDKNTKPHTLQVIKTRVSHNKALALWKTDEALLNRLNSFI